MTYLARNTVKNTKINQEVSIGFCRLEASIELFMRFSNNGCSAQDRLREVKLVSVDCRVMRMVKMSSEFFYDSVHKRVF
jgi:hypothetical protein